MIDLTAARIRLRLEALEPIRLPEYQGSTFRGAFGTVFRRLCCAQRQAVECEECLLRMNCPFSLIFTPRIAVAVEYGRGMGEQPRPFVLEPPANRRTEYTPGEEIVLHLVLIGKALEYLAYFILTLHEMGGTGLGMKRGRFRFVRAEALTAEGEPCAVISDGITMTGAARPITSNDLLQSTPGGDGDRFAIDFETMTRLKSDGAYAGKPLFPILVRTLLRRLTALQYYYGDGARPDLDYQSIIEAAGAVRLVKDDTRWRDWERYSKRQDRRMTLGGIVGRAEYEGSWGEFAELIRWGELAHVGKGATFGLGKYRMRSSVETVEPA